MKTFKAKHGEDLANNTAFHVHEVARLFRTTFDRKMKALRLNRSHWWLISFLVHFEGCTQQELAEVMDIGKAGLGKLVDRLESDGLVQRLADPADRRLNRMRLTSKARPIANEITRASEETVALSVSELTPAEIATLHKLLKKMKQSLSTAQVADSRHSKGPP
jgi:DNA-binding MarR family transcriptional regulator